ncbi:MAG TPA: MoxR family ATPase [Chloroflexota bacterium]|jgi:MoxR-like ATPase|nr:MoxR family ATPase [Chloroflexota bacterium]
MAVETAAGIEVAEFVRRFHANIDHVIVGKSAVIDLVLVALIVEGHVLFEDVPGVGKTMLARAVAITLGASFKRIQFTPDLLPSDVTGVSVFNQASGGFEFRAGPVFVHILLADEINRATPRTQSALLEAMGEGQITADGETRELPRPFLVLATQNPVEYEGTFPLPEAQLDRFLLRLQMGYPDFAEERQVLENLRHQHPITQLQPAVNIRDLSRLQVTAQDVHLDASVIDYLLRLVAATRNHPDLSLGASPRGSLALYKAAQALALIRGRDFVTPDDIKELVPAVLPHRLIVKPESEVRGRTRDAIVKQLLADVEVGVAEDVEGMKGGARLPERA